MNKILTSKVRLIFLVFVLSIAALALSACAASAGGATVIHATLTEFKIELDKTSIPAGPVKFVIENKGEVFHEFVLEPAGAHDEPFMAADGRESEAENIEKGKTATLEWTITDPGEYQLTCYIEGHSEAGMTTTFTVTAP